MPYNKFDLAVIGLGPSGLASALEAARRGMTVVAFTNRTEYVRQQRIKCSLEVLDFLDSFYDTNNKEDVEFFRSLSSEPIVQIKDLERFLMRVNGYQYPPLNGAGVK